MAWQARFYWVVEIPHEPLAWRAFGGYPVVDRSPFGWLLRIGWRSSELRGPTVLTQDSQGFQTASGFSRASPLRAPCIVQVEASLAVRALKTALRRRGSVKGLTHHSDRGVQYASKEYTDLLKEHGVRISMSRKGNPYDNAKCESFMKTLKYEEVVCCERLAGRGQAVLYRRWRMALRSQPAGAGFKPPQAAGVKSPGGERCGKGGSNSVR